MYLLKLIPFLLSLLEGKSDPKPGTYAGVKYTDDTLDSICKYMEDNEIANPLSRDKIHTTLLYSKKHCPNYEALGDIDPTWSATPDKLEVWKSGDDEPVNILVIKLKSPELSDRHKKLMDEHEATYDFPEYIPHITLSYDAGDVDLDKLSPISVLGDFKINKEYHENLKTDWSKD